MSRPPLRAATLAGWTRTVYLLALGLKGRKGFRVFFWRFERDCYRNAFPHLCKGLSCVACSLGLRVYSFRFVLWACECRLLVCGVRVWSLVFVVQGIAYPSFKAISIAQVTGDHVELMRRLLVTGLVRGFRR